METRTARPSFEKPKKLVFNRLRESYPQPRNDQICSFWRAGKCNRNPCRFLHLDLSHPRQHQEPHIQSQPERQPKRPRPVSSDDHCGNRVKSTWRNPHLVSFKIAIKGIEKQELRKGSEGPSSKIVRTSPTKEVNSVVEKTVIKEQELRKGPENVCEKNQSRVCKYWVAGSCVNGSNCKDLHSWFIGSGISLLAKLEKRHKKAISGVSLPSGSDKLFCGSKDESLSIWDCHSGQCVNTVKLGSEIGCLISEGPWVFVGLKNCVKAYNIDTQTELLLSGANGLVHSIATATVDDDMLFGGIEDGSILLWKSTPESQLPVVVATLTCHKLAVLCLVVGAGRLHSGSMDETIRVWDVKTLQCLHVLNGHSGVITSVLFWDSYLLSGSLDNTLKMWALNENGKFEVVHEVEEGKGIRALCKIHDSEANPILLCSCDDSTVCLYNLPSLTERGRIFAEGVVESIGAGCSDLFFTGDTTGQLCVWKMIGQPKE